MKSLKAITLGLLLTLASPLAAWAQCSGQAPSLTYCGNPTGSLALPGWKSFSGIPFPNISGGTVVGNRGTSSTAATPLTNPILGIPGTSTGELGFAGVTNGTATLRAQAAAGSAVLLLPTGSGTLASAASSPLSLSATTGALTCPTCVTSSGGGAISGTAPIAVSAAGVVSISAPYTTLTASNGGIVYSGATNLAILSGTATARQMLQSGVSAAPAWSTSTWPATTTINQILYSSSANTVAELATANNAVLVTNASGVPSLSTILPVGVGREKLSAARAYYVRTSGNDSNCSGLVDADDPGTGTIPRACAFATPQKPTDVILYTLDLNGQTVTTTLTGSFTSGILCSGAFTGGGSVVYGGTGSITTTSANAIAATAGCRITVSGLTLSTITGGVSLLAYSGGFISMSGLTFGPSATGDMQAGYTQPAGQNAGGGTIYITGNYTIAAGTHSSHVHPVTEGSLISFVISGVTVTLSGTPTFTNFFLGITKGFYYAPSVTYSGAAIGPRFVVHNHGAYFGATSLNSLPGSIDAVPTGAGIVIVDDVVNYMGVAYMISTPTTVSALTACSSIMKGAHAFVTDNNTALAFAAVITTGGSIQTPVYCDGTVWRQG